MGIDLGNHLICRGHENFDKMGGDWTSIQLKLKDVVGVESMQLCYLLSKYF